MGHDITIIGKHQLDTTSPRHLAEDLSERLQTRVEHQIQYYDKTKGEFSDDTWETKFVIGNQYVAKSTLIYYVNDDINPTSEKYYEGCNDIRLWFQEEDIEHKIGLDAINLCCKNIPRWYQFVDWITYPDYTYRNGEILKDYINRFRINVQKTLLPFGGNEVLLFSDQAEFAIYEDAIYQQTFEQIKTTLQTKAAKAFRNIEVELSYYPTKNLYESAKNFKVFYDSFS